MADKLRFKQWFYGHMHIDRWWRRPYTALYDVIYDLDGTGRTPFSPTAARNDSLLDSLDELTG